MIFHTSVPADEPERVAAVLAEVVDPEPHRYGCFHLALATNRTAGEILAIGKREGWRTLRFSRGGLFDVIELWLEDSLLVEVLTAEMQADYLARVKIGIWREPVSSRAA